ncbi:MAG TPA: hypothetical protein VFQ53_05905 [Kofleriaceae bacterium]|nr:hypothetical protein [Kofleriaceae bacterium]
MTDRPWGVTLGALGYRRLTGQLTVFSDDGKDYVVAFDRGAVVGATSPLVSDSAARVALTNHLITSTHVPEVARRLADQPGRDEIDCLAEVCRLSPEQVYRLRQRVIAQRAARTFSVERGSFVVDDAVTIPTAIAAAVDFRAIVYFGVKLNLSEQRLAADLRQLGSHFTLKPDAVSDLPQFGLTTSELPILEELKTGTTLPELEARHRDIDPRSARSVIYALVACFAAEATAASAPEPDPAQEFQPVATGTRGGFAEENGVHIRQTRTVTADRDPTPRTVTRPRDLAERIADTPAPRARPSSDRPPEARTFTGHGRTGSSSTLPPDVRAAANGVVPVRTTTPPPATGRSTTHRSGPIPTVHNQSGPIPRTTTVARSAPHPTSTPPTGSGPVRALPEPGRAPTPAQPVLARTGSPTHAPLPSRTVTPTSLAATDPRTTTDRTPKLDDTGPPSGEHKVIDPIAAAAEAFARGKAALKADSVLHAIDELANATRLDPANVDYQAMLAWAQFCAASDKQKIADRTRKVLSHAIQKSKSPEVSRFYLGRVERMLGRDREALRHFQEVIELQPRNADARSEIRAIENRLASGSAEKPGLSSLFSRKKP